MRSDTLKLLSMHIEETEATQELFRLCTDAPDLGDPTPPAYERHHYGMAISVCLRLQKAGWVFSQSEFIYSKSDAMGVMQIIVEAPNGHLMKLHWDPIGTLYGEFRKCIPGGGSELVWDQDWIAR